MKIQFILLFLKKIIKKEKETNLNTDPQIELNIANSASTLYEKYYIVLVCLSQQTFRFDEKHSECYINA